MSNTRSLRDRIIDLAPRAALLRQQIEVRQREMRTAEAFRVDATALRTEIEARESELRAIEDELDALLQPQGDVLRATPPEGALAGPASTPILPERPSPSTSVAAERGIPTKGMRVPGSLPDRVLARIEAAPDRTFRARDFADMGSMKRIFGVLHRLAADEHAIARVDHGVFRATDGAPRREPPPPAAADGSQRGAIHDGPTAQRRVLAFMQRHADEWLRSPEVTTRMNISPALKSAVHSSLERLVTKGALEKKGTSYRLATHRAEAKEADGRKEKTASSGA